MKVYDGLFLELFAEAYESKYKPLFEAKGIWCVRLGGEPLVYSRIAACKRGLP